MGWRTSCTSQTAMSVHLLPASGYTLVSGYSVVRTQWAVQLISAPLLPRPWSGYPDE
jgi:hypothetical protein